MSGTGIPSSLFCHCGFLISRFGGNDQEEAEMISANALSNFKTKDPLAGKNWSTRESELSMRFKQSVFLTLDNRGYHLGEGLSLSAPSLFFTPARLVQFTIRVNSRPFQQATVPVYCVYGACSWGGTPIIFSRVFQNKKTCAGRYYRDRSIERNWMIR